MIDGLEQFFKIIHPSSLNDRKYKYFAGMYCILKGEGSMGNFKISRINMIYIFAMIGIFIGALFSLSVGSVAISPIEVFKVLLKLLEHLLYPTSFRNWIFSTEENIILQLRFPRIILAFFVGAELSSAGVLYQGIFRNPMADPYIIGASAGASLGATLGILFFRHQNNGDWFNTFCAFVGAAGTIFWFIIWQYRWSTYSFTLLLRCSGE